MLRAEALKAVTHQVAAPHRILRTLQRTRLRRVIERKSAAFPQNGAFHRPRICGFAPLFLLFLIVTSGLGRALDSGQPASPYLRTVFTTEDGLPDNVVNAIVQTANGFLWLGTDGGLARFDGHRFTAVHLRGGVANESPVQSLLEASNGDLWVGTDAGLAQLPKAALDHFDRSLVKIYHLGIGLSDQIMCIHMSRDGVLWLGTNRGLYSLNQGRFAPVIAGESISRIEAAPDGHLLIITGHGFVEWNGTRIVAHPEMARQLDVNVDGIFHVLEDSHGVRWFSTTSGVARRVNGSIQKLAPYVHSQSQTYFAFRLYEDPKGNMWVAAQSGLFRAGDSSLQPVVRRQDAPKAIYFDRDGDLWFSTNNEGLIRLKKRVLRMYTTADGLPGSVTMTVLSSHDGTLWVGSNCGGLSRFDGQRFTTYKEVPGLPSSCVWSLAEDKNNDIWVGTWGGGISRLHDGRFTNYSIPQGLPSDVALSLVAARDGSLWIATSAGLSHMQNGRFRNYTTADGLSSDRIITVYQDHSGGIWVGTSTGIDRLAGDHFEPVQAGPESANLPYDNFTEGSSGALYALSLMNGINRIDGNRIVNVWPGIAPLGMVESDGQSLWFSGKHGISRIAANDLQRAEHDRESPLDYITFGSEDGLITSECSGGQPNMAITQGGKLWVATIKGLAMLDIEQPFRTRRRPDIFIGTVSIDGKGQLSDPTLSLLPGTHHVEFHFDAVDLMSPEKVRLQYRMDGVDKEWLDGDSTRAAIYTSIPIGTHALHVRGTDTDGVWDRVGLTYQVTQQPYFYQTMWFTLIAATGLVLLLAGIYFLRVRQIVREVRNRLEERMSERERIARELHDTLLQGFQGLILRFHAVAVKIPSSELTRQMLEKALERADEVLVEGRDCVNDLRVMSDLSTDLSQALARAGRELVLDNDTGIDFTVAVDGDPQALHPIVQNEVISIGREALANAFHHAEAKHVEVEIAYRRDEMRLRLRDDGRGIEKGFLEGDGKKGHWGIRGMRERAQKIGSHLTIFSRPGAGTEVELRVPGALAYQSTLGGSRWERFLRTARGNLN
jgi:signal transduction histidine kinase/ligand-binding sensor domain-containing protein